VHEKGGHWPSFSFFPSSFHGSEDLHQLLAVDAYRDELQLHFRRRKRAIRIEQQVVPLGRNAALSSESRTVEIVVRMAIGFQGGGRRIRMSRSRKVPGC
jgi:hypothetical protein